MVGVPPSGSGHSPKGGAATASPAKPSVPNAVREPNIVCPHCHQGLFVDAIGAVGRDQRMSTTIHPLAGTSMIQAEALCGQVTDLDKIMQMIAEQDGGKVRTYVERIGMTDDGGFRFDLAVLPVRSAPPVPKQRDLPLASAIEAPSGVETAQTGSTEGESATSEAGDAQ
jgi:hypothetical protein